MIDLHHPSYSWPVTAAIDLVSVGKGNSQRDAHLRSPGFFDGDNHPRMTAGRHASAQKSPLHAQGELTLTGVTKNVPLALKVNGFGPDTAGTRAGLTAPGELNRQNFGVTWTAVIEAGSVAVARPGYHPPPDRGRAPGISRVHQPDPEPVPIDAQEPR